MDSREAKLALARKKLKDHQEKKQVFVKTTETLHQHTSNVDCSMDKKIQSIDNYADITTIEYEDKNVNKSQPMVNYCQPHQIIKQPDLDINVTEILISNERNLEVQVMELQSKLAQLDTDLRLEVDSHNNSKKNYKELESKLEDINDKYCIAIEEIKQLDKSIYDLNALKSKFCDENNNLLEQLEFTKSMLTAKETENATLFSQLHQIQNEFDVTKLQLQQLTNGSNTILNKTENINTKKSEEMAQKIQSLEQQLKSTQKERDQINNHYEHYVAELNEELKSVVSKNEELSKEVQYLSDRETSLIEQISDMEIRMQNLHFRNLETVEKHEDKSIDSSELQKKIITVQEQLQFMTQNYEQLQKVHTDKQAKIEELQEALKTSCDHEDISLSKLTADIASDKLAAQRATEQNKKLKTSVQELEEAFIKMSQDKLELTEKITAEKYLNRELTIKLAECEEKSKDMHIKLRAKDVEMIRLQTSNRELEKNIEKISESIKNYKEQEIKEISECNHHNHETEAITCNEKNDMDGKRACEHDPKIVNIEATKIDRPSPIIPKEDAMVKLQERFLKIMGEVADLSDEKHRLEHIILQLQNETDTICEYVALYQQQRCLLKKRDEERSAQVKLFQIECDRLKNQLEELSGILLRFAEDKELSTYFQVESRQKDMEKVRSLLFNLKSNTLVDPKINNLELNNIYPCNCCSGNLIDV